MSGAIGWALAAAAFAVGYVQWGWRGIVVAATVVAFWLLLQFSRALRVLRAAGQAPVGHVDSAVMLHSKLAMGQSLPQILALTKSLGERLADDPETFVWRDNSGASVRIELKSGKLTHWTLQREAAPSSAAPAP